MTAVRTDAGLDASLDVLAPPTEREQAKPRSKKRSRRRLKIVASQLLVLVVFFAAWQFLPLIPALAQASHLFDPYFVSSPTRVAVSVYNLAVGANGQVLVWPYLGQTIFTSVIGTIIGIVLGGLGGLILSNFAFMSAVLRPFVVALNATPRIALIPVVVIICGVTQTTSIVIAVMVVFFVAFFNAYEGGISIPQPMVQNARLLGADNFRILSRVRVQYVLAWTIAGLPLAATFAIISVVTGEILTGFHGAGFLLTSAETTGDSSLTFAVVIYLATLGLAVVIIAEGLRKRVLHWWAR
jgi:NitT/TauT family transport system permease protein